MFPWWWLESATTFCFIDTHPEVPISTLTIGAEPDLCILCFVAVLWKAKDHKVSGPDLAYCTSKRGELGYLTQYPKLSLRMHWWGLDGLNNNWKHTIYCWSRWSFLQIFLFVPAENCFLSWLTLLAESLLELCKHGLPQEPSPMSSSRVAPKVTNLPAADLKVKPKSIIEKVGTRGWWLLQIQIVQFMFLCLSCLCLYNKCKCILVLHGDSHRRSKDNTLTNG